MQDCLLFVLLDFKDFFLICFHFTHHSSVQLASGCSRNIPATKRRCVWRPSRWRLRLEGMGWPRLPQWPAKLKRSPRPGWDAQGEPQEVIPLKKVSLLTYVCSFVSCSAWQDRIRWLRAGRFAFLVRTRHSVAPRSVVSAGEVSPTPHVSETWEQIATN